MIGRAPFATVPGEPNPPSTDPLALLNYALKRGVVSLVNFGAAVTGVSVNTMSGELCALDDPEAFDGLLFVEAPVEVCRDLDGPPEEQDAYVLICIPRAVVDAMDEEARKPSLILVPPGIVRPS